MVQGGWVGLGSIGKGRVGLEGIQPGATCVCSCASIYIIYLPTHNPCFLSLRHTHTFSCFPTHHYMFSTHLSMFSTHLPIPPSYTSSMLTTLNLVCLFHTFLAIPYSPISPSDLPTFHNSTIPLTTPHLNFRLPSIITVHTNASSTIHNPQCHVNSLSWS